MSFVIFIFLIVSVSKRFKDLKAKRFIMLITPIQWISCLLKNGTKRQNSILYKRVSLIIFILVSFLYYAPVMINAKLFGFYEKSNHHIEIKKNTLLHMAVAYNSIRYSKLLIYLGANVNAFNEYNMTPMHIAIMQGNFEIAKLLIKHKLDLNLNTSLSNNSLKTNNYLHFIVHIKQNNIEKILKLFLQHEIDINRENHLGRTAVYFASENYRPEWRCCILRS